MNSVSDVGRTGTHGFDRCRAWCSTSQAFPPCSLGLISDLGDGRRIYELLASMRGIGSPNVSQGQ